MQSNNFIFIDNFSDELQKEFNENYQNNISIIQNIDMYIFYLQKYKSDIEFLYNNLKKKIRINNDILYIIYIKLKKLIHKSFNFLIFNILFINELKHIKYIFLDDYLINNKLYKINIHIKNIINLMNILYDLYI